MPKLMTCHNTHQTNLNPKQISTIYIIIFVRNNTMRNLIFIITY